MGWRTWESEQGKVASKVEMCLRKHMTLARAMPGWERMPIEERYQMNARWQNLCRGRSWLQVLGLFLLVRIAFTFSNWKGKIHGLRS